MEGGRGGVWGVDGWMDGGRGQLWEEERRRSGQRTCVAAESYHHEPVGRDGGWCVEHIWWMGVGSGQGFIFGG